MSTQIHVVAEIKTRKGRHQEIDIPEGCCDWNCTNLYAWLAGVRNRAAITPISEARDFPKRFGRKKEWLENHCYYSISWLTIDELLAVDYNQIIENRRCSIREDGTREFRFGGADTCPEGEGVKMPLHEFVGEEFLRDLQILKEHKVDRIVFCFS